MKCPRCQQENPPQAKFCLECATPLAPRCTNCGTQLPAGAKFCFECATPVSAPGTPPRLTSPEAYTPKHLADKILKSRSALEGERRQVTVLFADLAGFTSLAEKLDPEQVHAIIDRFFELVTAEVHRFEGTINQYTGDGVMALFGAPIAHEDGPRRAVHASLGIQRAIREYGRQLQAERGLTLQLRIGLHTGPVVVGKIGDDLRMDYTAVGDTTNVAARLQQAARPGSVFVSEALHRTIAGYFETVDLGELPAKGHAAVRAFEILRARGRRARLDVAAERGLTPLVGRERELDALVDRFRQVRAGRGQVISIVGEAGIGKSRLLYEFRRRLVAAGEDATWLEGRSVSFGQAIPFLPLVDQIRESFGITEFDGEPEIIAKVEHGMRAMGGLAEHIPFIRYLLAVDPGDPAVTGMDASARRKRILDAARAMAFRAATFRPVVFVFEDLHWIDTSSEEHIFSLVDSLAGVPIMLILTYRVGYSPSFGTRSFHTTLMLSSLTEGEALAMAGGVLGTGRFPQELRTALMDKAEGIPLFVEEVTKTLLDLGVLRRDNGGYRMVKGLDEVSVPDTIQGIIMARLDRLGEDGKRTVQLASVIGRQFLRRLLERIAGLPGQLEGLLGELKTLEIIYEAGLLAEPAYVFKHAVIQDVAYQSLLVQRRRELHRAVALAIEELYPERLPEHYAELAHHFAQAEEWRKAMEYAALAGHRTADAFANVEAEAHYARALQAARRLGPQADPSDVADLHARHGAVLMVLGRYEESVAAHEEALALARTLGDRKREASILIAVGGVYNFYHRPDEALTHLDHALVIAREHGDRAAQAMCLASSAFTRAACGRIETIGTSLEDALRLAPEVGDPKQRALAHASCGVVLQWRGDLKEGLAHLHEAAVLAEATHAGSTWALAAYGLGHALLSKGEYEAALSWYRRLQDYALAAGDMAFITRSPNIIAGVHLELFDFDEAMRLGAEGDETCRKITPYPEPRAHSLLKVGLGHLGHGELGAADEVFRQIWPLLNVEEWGRWRWHIALLRVCGELALAGRRYDEAWDFATQSLQISTETRSLKHVARAEHLKGDILVARGRPEAALEPLRASVTLAESLGTLREVWMGKASLGRALVLLGQDRAAEATLTEAAKTIEGIVAALTTPALRRSFVEAAPVRDVSHALGRPVPAATDNSQVA
jgi:class 3 adenylate cyclase/tetratricopeptide (TPR) repeat protein